jgi:hypothetical protein
VLAEKVRGDDRIHELKHDGFRIIVVSSANQPD